MDDRAEWPQAVIDEARRLCGGPVSLERLGGMSGASVFRARSSRHSLIVKTSRRENEALFYETVAPHLRGAGVPIPDLESLLRFDGRCWLFIEDIPSPLVTGDESSRRLLQVLTLLHRQTRGLQLDFPDSPSRHWTDQVTAAAATLLPEEDAGEIRALLAVMQRQAARLAEDWCWISGDTSPPNWGVRADGSLALYDWELFRRGVPAGDLAPTVPGLPGLEAFRLRAAAYISAWGDGLPWSEQELARDTALAKVQTVAMLLAAHAGGGSRVPAETIAWLLAAVPGWLRSLYAELDL